MIVTIDGFAKSGKSAAAEGLAQALGFTYLNTGAMYRAAARQILQNDFDIFAEAFDGNLLKPLMNQLHFSFVGSRISVNGEDVTDYIQHTSVGNGASMAGTFAVVREKLKLEQKRIVAEWLGAGVKGVVSEGRDQGSVVFPEAFVKFYFWASVKVRAKRITGQTDGAEFEKCVKELKERDARDTQRAMDPLCPPHLAVCIDNSAKPLADIVADMVAVVRKVG